MNSQNVCKFVYKNDPETLVTSKFIFEASEHRREHCYSGTGDMLCLVASGAGIFTLGKTSRQISAGDLFFVFAGEPCRIESTDNLQYMYVEYAGGRCNSLYTRCGVSDESRFFPGMGSLVPLFKESLLSADAHNVDLLSESVLLYAFSKIRSAPVCAPDTLVTVREYIEKHFTEPDLSLSSVACALGYNDKYLSHLLKTRLGAGFSEYLKNLRLRCAILLMRQGVSSVKNIAILSGFSDPLYFSKVFRQEFGASPREYIEKMTSGEIPFDD